MGATTEQIIEANNRFNNRSNNRFNNRNNNKSSNRKNNHIKRNKIKGVKEATLGIGTTPRKRL